MNKFHYARASDVADAIRQIAADPAANSSRAAPI